MTAALDSGRLDPSQISGDQLLRLSHALNTLGVHDYGDARLQAAGQAHIEHCRAAFEEKLEVLVRGLAGGSGAAPMLRALGRARRRIACAPASVRAAFSPGMAEPAASSSAASAPQDGTFHIRAAGRLYIRAAGQRLPGCAGTGLGFRSDLALAP